MDAVLLSRIQFAWVIALHILLPAFTVGLSCYVATLEVRWWLTKKDVYRRLSAFWIKIFAISFGMGVVSGIVMPFQFGTNWSRFADGASNVIGPLLAYEVIMAFFLEAAFLGVLLFGRKLVPQWAHAGSAVMVAVGTLMSSFWIIAVNSWMQTPRGYIFKDGRYFPTDMLAVIFTPSFPYRLVHTVTAFVITTAFVILGLGAHYLLQKRHQAESQIMIRMSIAFLAIMIPFQIFVGDLHGLNTLKYQPEKLAAMEGLWETRTRVPASLFAIPDAQEEKNHYEIAIPDLASLYLTHDPNGEVKGLKAWPRKDRPPVAIVYFAFRIMVGLGLLMGGVVATGVVLWIRRRLFETPWFLRLCRWTTPIGFVAVLAGWTTTETGRQPWVIYGLMRTSDAVTPSLTVTDVEISLLLYVISYVVIFGGGATVLWRLFQIGIPAATEGDEIDDSSRPARPLSAAGLIESGQEHLTGETPMLDLVPLWAGILGLAVLMYVLLDGFDLGVGILFLLRHDETDRNLMIGSVGPIWDFNETWLVLGGGGLLAAFPLAFAIIIPAVYFPILVMLLGLLFRGVAFEFREIEGARRAFWNAGFGYGSIVAAFAQGVVLGCFVRGFPIVGRSFAGTSWDWVAPFPLLTGAGLVVGYMLLGATWLVMKTEGNLQEWARKKARLGLVGIILFVLMISVWTPLADARIANRWFSFPNVLFFAPVPILTAGLSWLLWDSLHKQRDAVPFLCAMGIFFLGFTGLIISIWPYVALPSVTLWDAAAAPISQEFLMVGTLFLLPIILLYVFWSYWLFRGKVRHGSYH